MNLLIGLCVYNNEKGLPNVFSNIIQIIKSNIFNRVDIAVFYDKSEDKSLELLEIFNLKYNIEIIINKSERFTSRTKNIAVARNAILQYIRNNPIYEYFIMMDSNEYACVGEINTDVIEYVMKRNDEWDSISFDREAGYYDTWALSFDPYIYSPFHCENAEFVIEKMRSKFNNTLDYYKKNTPYKFIEVYSAFNGFAIYKTSVFIECSYSSLIKFDLFPKDILKKQIKITKSKFYKVLDNDCEHRAFHLEAIKKNNARIRICTRSLFSKLPVSNLSLRGPA
jgi:hypothetical protein